MNSRVKWVILMALALGVVVFAGCTISNSKAICRDGKCDASESCECIDCRNDEKCKVNVIATCDDKNECTEDSFNELTKQCEYKRLGSCCGNGICEESERCNIEKAETVCEEDCQLTCPAKVIISGFECSGSNCKENSENNFEISGDDEIKAVLTNIGERSTEKMNSDFRCIGENAVPVSGDYKEIKGLKLRDYFGEGDESSVINSRISKIGNSKDYKVKFEFSNVKFSFNLVCNAVIRDDISAD